MSKATTIIIHSKVSYGYVGSNTTSLVLQMGTFDVITVPTVLYSNHLGHPTYGGGIVPDNLFEDILKGILKLQTIQEVSTIITGFIGSTEQVKLCSSFIHSLKKINPKIQYICDPVMGDTDKGLYVPADIPEAIIQYLIPLADLLTPNRFEAERIFGQTINSEENLVQLIQEKLNPAKQKIVITGGDTSNTELISISIIENAVSEILKTRKIHLHPPGTGELFTAHVHLAMLKGLTLRQAALLAGEKLSAVLHAMSHQNRNQFELQDILFSMQATES